MEQRKMIDIPIGTTVRSAVRAPIDGDYEFVEHLAPSDCKPSGEQVWFGLMFHLYVLFLTLNMFTLLCIVARAGFRRCRHSAFSTSRSRRSFCGH